LVDGINQLYTPTMKPCSHPVLVTSQPKNGTHLLLNTLSLIPGLKENHLPHINWGRRDKIFEQLQLLQAGEFSKAHLIYQGKADRFFKENNFLLFNMIRDPRDNLVSYLFYLKKTTHHRLHPSFIEMFDNDDERLMALINGFNFTINGIKNKINSIDKPLMNWMPWNNCSYCMPVRFEHLIGEQGGGTHSLQQQEITKILSHLSIKPTSTLVNQIAENCYASNAYSFRKGQISEWKTQFKTQHKQAFKKIANQALIHYGYEQDDRW